MNQNDAELKEGDGLVTDTHLNEDVHGSTVAKGVPEETPPTGVEAPVAAWVYPRGKELA